MYEKQRYNFLIIGQGLAGSCLSYQLIKRNKSVFVIDAELQESSSKAAAGLYNPVTGRKMVMTWMASKLFPYLINFYGELEKLLHQNFLYPRTIYRPFKTIEEYNDWFGKSEDIDDNRFMEKITNTSEFELINDNYGGLLLKQSGFLDIKSFLAAYKNFLIKRASYSKEVFQKNDLQKIESGFCYKGMIFEKVIFCSGTHSLTPNFKWLPFKPVKGEVLGLKLYDPLNEQTIYNKGCFLMKSPKADEWWLGSTYHHQNLNWENSEKGIAELKEKLEKMYTGAYELNSSWAGIRPATMDRKPFIGMHPEEKAIGIFNGLGAKGVSLAPYFSEHFVNHLLDNESLDKNVDIMRYFNKLVN